MKRLEIVKQIIANKVEQPYTKIIIEKNKQIATIWMNSPNDLNCLSKIMMAELIKAIQSLNDDPKIKVLLLRSKVSKIFCAGANIKGFTQYDLSSYPGSMHFKFFYQSLKKYPKPIVSVVQAGAFGGGFEIALISDIILCSQKAQFGLPQITLGIIPGIGGTQILPRIVGTKVAQRMILTGLPIDAKEAHQLNIAYLLPKQQFQQKVQQIVGRIASKSLETILGAKKAVNISQQTTLQQGIDHQGSIFGGLFNKKGAKQGIAAFLQKRKPNFTGI